MRTAAFVCIQFSNKPIPSIDPLQISTDGIIEQFCIPHFDSPSVFARVLDINRGGHFSIRPIEKCNPKQGYLPSTNVIILPRYWCLLRLNMLRHRSWGLSIDYRLSARLSLTISSGSLARKE